MKKKLSTFKIAFLFAITFLCFFTSCSDLDNLPYTNNMVSDLSSINDSVMTIKKLSNEAKNQYKVTLDDAKNLSKAYKFKNSKIEAFNQNGDTLLYIINHKNGWTIVAGDKRINPTVAVSDEGVLSKFSINDNLKAWIDSYADAIRVVQSCDTIPENTLSIKENGKVKENKYINFWSKISPKKKKNYLTTRSSATYKWAVVSRTYLDHEDYSDEFPRLISTAWGQWDPYWNKLPLDTSVEPTDYNENRCRIGCAAVAASQMIYYMHYFLGKPTGLYHDISISAKTVPGATSNIGFSRSNYVSNSTRWNEMILSKYDSNGNTEYVGDLMLDVGNRLNMVYSGTGSGADFSPAAFANYNLTYTRSMYDYQKVKK